MFTCLCPLHLQGAEMLFPRQLNALPPPPFWSKSWMCS